jgi:NADH dehydrogenase
MASNSFPRGFMGCKSVELRLSSQCLLLERPVTTFASNTFAMNIPESNHPRVVIIGGGFGGLMVAKSLKNKPFQVVLLDRHNYHTFQPLLYQVATAGLEPDSIAHPLRTIFTGYKNIFFRMAEVERLNTSDKCIETNIGSLDYDHLVIATGSETNFFGMESIKQQSMPMKSIPEALNLRSLMLQNFEAALLTDDLKKREALMNYVIVGAGPTGVELAGALAELKRHVLPHDYPDLDIRRMSIHLVEASDRVLAAMSETSSNKALDYLLKLGVHVWTSTMVKEYDGQTVVTNNKPLPASTLIWAAGVKGSFPGGLDAEKIISGRIRVDAYNRVEGMENVYAIGDVAVMIDEENPKGHPMLAQVAIQQGTLLGKNLFRERKGQAPVGFKYNDLGSMATVGRNLAVIDLPRMKVQGFFGWAIWMGVHLVSLIGFRNKVITLFNWIWNYLKYDRGVRLIIRPYKK